MVPICADANVLAQASMFVVSANDGTTEIDVVSDDCHQI